MTVFYTASGQVPLSTGDSSQKHAVGGIAIAEVPIENSYVVAPEDRLIPFVSRNSTTWATSTRATPAEEHEFMAIARASSNRIVVNAPPKTYGFESLAGAQMELVGPHLWAAMTASNPGWAGNELSGTVKSVLYRAVGWLNGKGPTACLVFENGDFGCFQINLADINAPIYVEDTGKDRDNNPISRTPSLPNGGNTQTKVVYESGGGRGYSAGGHQRLVCAFVDGHLDHCFVEYVIQ